MADTTTDPTAITEPQAEPTAEPQRRAKPKLRDFAEIKREADLLVDACSTRDTDFEKYEKLFKLDLDEELGSSAKRGIKTLYDPTAYNGVSAAVRMYAANPPSITIPTELDDGEGFTPERGQSIKQRREDADHIEQFIRAALYAQSTVTDRDWLMDSLYSMFLFGELTQVTDSPLDELGEEPTPDELAEIEAPFLLWVPSARLCYPRYSRRSGLLSHVYKAQVTTAEIRETYGAYATGSRGTFDIEDLTETSDTLLTLYDYMDRDQHTVWLDDHPGAPLLNTAIEYGFIPRVARRGAGVGFFEEEEYQRMPLLYAYLKAGLGAAANLLLTVQLNNVLDFSNPLWAMYLKPGREAPTIDFDKRGSTIQLEQGESIQPFYRSLVPPELTNLLAQVGQMSQDTTISRASLGALPNNAMAASALNLISMASRMATFLGARSAELACEATLSKMLRRIKKRNQVVRVWGENGAVSITPSQIGEHYRVRVKFRPDQQLEKQAIAGLTSMLFSQLGIGYDTAYEMLEEGGIIESASAAMDNHLERLFMEAELKNIVSSTSEFSRALLGMAKSIPEAQPLTPRGPMPAPSAPTPEGMAPPDMSQLAALMGGGGGPAGMPGGAPEGMPLGPEQGGMPQGLPPGM